MSDLETSLVFPAMRAGEYSAAAVALRSILSEAPAGVFNWCTFLQENNPKQAEELLVVVELLEESTERTLRLTRAAKEILKAKP